MDGFIRKVNQKVNLPGFAILKDRFLKTRPIKRFQNVVLQIQLSNACIGIYIYSAMKFHLMF